MGTFIGMALGAAITAFFWVAVWILGTTGYLMFVRFIKGDKHVEKTSRQL